MRKQIIWLNCFLFIISYNTLAQNIHNKAKIDSITNLIKSCVDCSHEYYMRANLNLKENKQMEAMSDFNNAIKIVKNYPKDHRLTEYYSERANLKSELGDFRGAIKDYDNASEVNYGYSSLWAEVFFGRGFCKTKVGDLEGAVEDYEHVFLHKPNDVVTHYNLGLLKISLGKKDEGCLYLSKAGELGYRDAYEAISDFCN